MRLSPALFLLLPALASAQDQTFRFNDPHGRDTVSFVLKAPIEKINGLSNTLLGEVQVKQGQVSGVFRVPVNSLKTGIALRDEHLTNDRWLDAAKQPELRFSFKDLKLPSALEPGKPVTVTAEGEFSIRGVTRKERIEVTATWMKESEQTRFRSPGDLLHLEASFRIPLEAYGIQRTQALLLKVGDTALVELDAWGSTRLPLPSSGVTRAGQP